MQPTGQWDQHATHTKLHFCSPTLDTHTHTHTHGLHQQWQGTQKTWYWAPVVFTAPNGPPLAQQHRSSSANGICRCPFVRDAIKNLGHLRPQNISSAAPAPHFIVRDSSRSKEPKSGGSGSEPGVRLAIQHPPPPPHTQPEWTRSVHLDTPGQQPVSGTADPAVVKQDNSSRGSVDTTKTCSNPQRVTTYNGERPIGPAKGKQTNTMASCQSPPPYLRNRKPVGPASASTQLRRALRAQHEYALEKEQMQLAHGGRGEVWRRNGPCGSTAVFGDFWNAFLHFRNRVRERRCECLHGAPASNTNPRSSHRRGQGTAARSPCWGTAGSRPRARAAAAG